MMDVASATSIILSVTSDKTGSFDMDSYLIGYARVVGSGFKIFAGPQTARHSRLSSLTENAATQPGWTFWIRLKMYC